MRGFGTREDSLNENSNVFVNKRYRVLKNISNSVYKGLDIIGNVPVAIKIEN